eukprot:1771380-Prymnesium_polylepis.1
MVVGVALAGLSQVGRSTRASAEGAEPTVEPFLCGDATTASALRQSRRAGRRVGGVTLGRLGC